MSLLALVTLLGCRSGNTIAVRYEPRPTKLDTQRNEAGIAHDHVLTPAKIRSLRQAILQADTRELRLSTGAGMIFGAEYGILRVVERGPVVDGEVWLYRGILNHDGKARFKVRSMRLRPKPNWKQLLARLDSLKADRIEVPSDGSVISDAGELYVESLRGSEYHSAAVNAPRLRKGPEARTAAVVAALVDSLVRESSNQR